MEIYNLRFTCLSDGVTDDMQRYKFKWLRSPKCVEGIGTKQVFYSLCTQGRWP